MGSYNDLPKDVIWLIFKKVMIDFLAQHYKATFDLDDHFMLPKQNQCTSKKRSPKRRIPPLA